MLVGRLWLSFVGCVGCEVGNFFEGKRVVTCVGNTIGIMPEDIGGVNVRAQCYTEMAKLAGPTGVAVIVYWNAKRFPDALKDFYGKHPELCGSLEGAEIRLPEEDKEGLHAGMVTKSGYSTKWTTKKGVEKIFQARPELEVLEISEIGNGKGVAVAFRSHGTGGGWEKFTPEQWYEAAHGPESFFKELNVATCQFILDAEKKYCTGDVEGPVSLTEVGCGTGEMLLPLIKEGTPFQEVVGIDINDKFIDYCKSELKTLKEKKGKAAVATNVHHVVGDVCSLSEVLNETMEGAKARGVRGERGSRRCSGALMCVVR